MFNNYESRAEANKTLNMIMIGSTTCLIYQDIKTRVLGIPGWSFDDSLLNNNEEKPWSEIHTIG